MNEEKLDHNAYQKNKKNLKDKVLKNSNMTLGKVPLEVKSDSDDEDEDEEFSDYDTCFDEMRPKHKNTFKKRRVQPPVNIFMNEDTKRNASFLESIMRQSEGCRLSTHTSLLNEPSKTLLTDSSLVAVRNQCTEDSGLGESEETEYMSKGPVVSRHVLYSSQLRPIISISLKDIVNYLREHLNNPKTYQYSHYKLGSFDQYICNIIKNSAEINNECKEIVKNFITEIIGTCCNTHEPHHSFSKIKFIVIEQLIGDIDICFKVLQVLRDNIARYITCLSENNNNLIHSNEQLLVFLDLYRKTCSKVLELQSKNCDTNKVQSETKVTGNELALQQGDSKHRSVARSTLIPQLEDYDIEVLEGMLRLVNPMIGARILKTLEVAKTLKDCSFDP